MAFPILAGLAMGALMGGGIAALQKKDILQGALMGGVGGALGGAFMPGVAGAAGAVAPGATSGSLGSLGSTTAGAANLFGSTAAGAAGAGGAGTTGLSSIMANAPTAGITVNGGSLIGSGSSVLPSAVPGQVTVNGAPLISNIGQNVASSTLPAGAGAGSNMFGGIGNFLSQNKGALTGGALAGMMAPAKEPEKQSAGNIYDMTFSQERNPLFGQPGQSAFINQGYQTNSVTPVEDYKPTMTAANGGIVALAEGGGLETQRYERPVRQMAPEVAAYNAKLMERANQQYNVNLPPAPNQVPGSVGYIAPPAPRAPTASTEKSISGLTFNPVTQQFEGEFVAPGKKKNTELFNDDLNDPYGRDRGYSHAAGDGGGDGGGGGEKNGGRIKQRYNEGGISSLGSYSDGGQLLRGPGDGVSDSIPAQIGARQPARLADGEFVVPARIVSELGNGSTDAGAKQLYAMMDRVQKNRKKTVGKGKVAVDAKSRKLLPA
jgi:hypothetical protein